MCINKSLKEKKLFDFNITETLMLLPGILIGLTFHEFSHAFVSDKLGDPTPRSQGRLTLFPLKHIDIIGFIMLLLFRFGWAKPVQINPMYYKKPRRDEILVSVAGVTMNLIIAIVCTGLLKIYFVSGVISFMNQTVYETVTLIIFYIIYINLILCLFNLIPIPPLDGFHILINLLPIRHTKVVYFLEQYGMFIVLGLIFIPSLLNLPSMLDYTLIPALDGVQKLLFWIFAIPL